MNMQVEAIEEFFKNLQDQICQALEAEDGLGKFVEDPWDHHSGGGGRTRAASAGLVACRHGGRAGSRVP